MVWSSEGSTYRMIVMKRAGNCSPFSNIMIAFCIACIFACGSLPSKASLISVAEEGLSKCTSMVQLRSMDCAMVALQTFTR